jgi:hypothetical protein
MRRKKDRAGSTGAFKELNFTLVVGDNVLIVTLFVLPKHLAWGEQ